MPLDESWELNERGQVKFAALMGYSMATMPEGGLVRLEYADTVEALDQRRATGLQLHFTAPQAREIGEALRRLAVELERQEKEGPAAQTP
ncbi:MAG TPA: hypothetical protein VF655_00690 [Allosphingosinicella sp.]|jgi:hypothetical protein